MESVLRSRRALSTRIRENALSTRIRENAYSTNAFSITHVERRTTSGRSVRISQHGSEGAFALSWVDSWVARTPY